VSSFWYLWWTRKAGLAAGKVKTVRWTVFRPWESPTVSERIPEGCEMKLKYMGSSRRRGYPNGVSSFWYLWWTRKAGLTAGKVKTVRWTVFRPWESPAVSERIPEGCEMKLKSMGAEEEEDTPL